MASFIRPGAKGLAKNATTSIVLAKQFKLPNFQTLPKIEILRWILGWILSHKLWMKSFE